MCECVLHLPKTNLRQAKLNISSKLHHIRGLKRICIYIYSEETLHAKAFSLHTKSTCLCFSSRRAGAKRHAASVPTVCYEMYISFSISTYNIRSDLCICLHTHTYTLALACTPIHSLYLSLSLYPMYYFVPTRARARTIRHNLITLSEFWRRQIEFVWKIIHFFVDAPAICTHTHTPAPRHRNPMREQRFIVIDISVNTRCVKYLIMSERMAWVTWCHHQRIEICFNAAERDPINNSDIIVIHWHWHSRWADTGMPAYHEAICVRSRGVWTHRHYLATINISVQPRPAAHMFCLPACLRVSL